MKFWIIRILIMPHLQVSYYKFWLFDSKHIWNCKKFQENIRRGDTIWFMESIQGSLGNGYF